MKDYRWISKDPVIDVIRGELSRHGNLSHKQIAKVSYDSGVSISTILNWMEGDVKRPQSLTTRAVLEAVGIKIVYERDDGTKVRQPPVEYISKEEQEKILRAEEKRERERARART